MGYSFQDGTSTTVQVDVPRMLEEFRRRLDEFAQNEDLARHIVDVEKRGDLKALSAVDDREVSTMSSRFWQSRDWFYDLQKIVPFLLLELLKHAPLNAAKLEKALPFWGKPFRWSPKGANPWLEVSKKYLSVLEGLRDQLELVQGAAAHAEKQGVEPQTVGKFKLFDSFGDPKLVETAVDVLKKASRAMDGIGLGSYCYGNVTLVNSSKIQSHSAAFYVKNTDEIYLSPNLRGQDVRAVCHEIGHRVHTKLHLSSRSKTLYESVKERSLWVTPYAKTDPEENFCEMLSFAAIRDISDDAKDLLRPALPGVKLATARGVTAAFHLSRRLNRMQTPAQRLAGRFSQPRRVVQAFKRRLADKMTRSEALRILGLSGNPTEQEIRKAQRIKAMEYGHDRPGGDVAKVTQANAASLILLEQLEKGYTPDSADDGRYNYPGAGPVEPPPKPVEVTFAEAKSKASIPANVKWLFVTESHSSGYSSDEFENRASGYVAVGETEQQWVFVMVEHYTRQDYIIGSKTTPTDVYNILSREVTKSGPPTPQLLYGGVVKMWGLFPHLEKKFNSKIHILPEGWDFNDFSKRTNWAMGRSTTIKNFLVDSGQVAEGDLKVPRKMNIEVSYAKSFDQKPGHYQNTLSRYGSDWEKLTLVVNGREHPLSESDMKKLGAFKVGGKRFMARVFGDYFYGGETKSLSRNRDGKAIMTWMAENLSLDAGVIDALKSAVAASK
jgi:hypothetical protein